MSDITKELFAPSLEVASWTEELALWKKYFDEQRALASFTLVQSIAIVILLRYSHASPEVSSALGGFVFWAFLFAVQAYVAVQSSVLLTLVPIANLFWASMVPSIWLWAYIVSSLLARALLRSQPILHWAVRVLDVDNHPLRALGIFAGLAMAIGTGCIVAISTVL
jgi:hypothetical protein